MSRLAKMAKNGGRQRSIRRKRLISPTNTSIQCVWAEQIEPFYFSLYSVILCRTILFFLKGIQIAHCAGSAGEPHNAEKACNTKDFEYPIGQIPCITGFLYTNNKRIDRSIESMLRSIFGAGTGVEPA